MKKRNRKKNYPHTISFKVDAIMYEFLNEIKSNSKIDKSKYIKYCILNSNNFKNYVNEINNMILEKKEERVRRLYDFS
jgi:5'(3')-deoxyribonucleotidase